MHFVRLPLPPAASLALAALAAAMPRAANAARWGEVGHRIIGEAAARALPAEMPAFFRNAVADFAYLNPEPDRWRDQGEVTLDPALGIGGGFDHFIDFEGVPDTAFNAPTRYDFLLQLRAVNKDHTAGLLPYRILELTQRLRVEWRLWRTATDPVTKGRIEARLINDAGILGHYVGDGANPHHTTIHHNGWIGANPKGYATDRRTHYRFEGVYVANHMTLGDVQPRVAASPTVFDNVRVATLAYLRSTFALVEPLYDLDKSEAFDEKTQGAAHREFVTKRLAAGATMLRDLWVTAYMTSSNPVPARTRGPG